MLPFRFDKKYRALPVHAVSVGGSRLSSSAVLLLGALLLWQFLAALTTTSLAGSSSHAARRVHAEAASDPLTIMYASFFAEDDPDNLPVADTGQPFRVLAGIWGVHKYMAYLTAASGEGNGFAVIEAGRADVNIRVLLNEISLSKAQGIVFRATDAGNLFLCAATGSTIRVLREQAGSFVEIGSYNGGIAAGDDLTVELSGPSIVVRQNGSTRLTLQDSFNQAATAHGLYANNSQASFKNFNIEVSATTADWIRLLTPGSYQVFQRDDAGHAAIQIQGTYGGTPTAIEARYKDGNWRTIDAAPHDGKFSGALPDQGQGQGALEVRFVNNPLAFWRQRYVGIGDVFLVAGQSNAEGRLTKPQFYHHPTLRAGVYDQSGKWREAYDPTDSSFNDKYSIWPLLATEIMTSQNVPVAFITTAEGSTGLLANGGTWVKPNPTYNQCASTVKGSGVNGLKAILWHQGETDTVAQLASVYTAKNYQKFYENALKSVRENLSADLGFAQLKMVAAQIGYFDSGLSLDTRPLMDAVRLAQSHLWDTEPNILAGPVLYDLDLSRARGGDGQHILKQEHAQVLTARWWHMLKFDLYGSGGSGRGPRAVTANLSDRQHVDVNFSSGAGLRLPQETAGWRVIDGNGQRLILNTTQQGGLVQLTLDQPVVGNVSVAWASANDAVGTKFTDLSADVMPTEPFQIILNSSNPLEDAQFFVRQQYLDFLEREPDPDGLVYWTDQIKGCTTDTECLKRRRTGVSAAFFIEQEFQETGFFVYRLSQASYGTRPNFAQFTADHRRVIGGAGVEAGKQALVSEWVQRTEFLNRYPQSMINAEFVNKLYDTAGLKPFSAERASEIAAVNAGETRAQALRNLIELADFKARTYNQASVLMQYFGYLRRDPDEDGYLFWLNVMNNRVPGNYASMVCAFITSAEYQLRFGQYVTRSNRECS